MPGFPDLFTIIVILAIVFGATLLPSIGETIGKKLSRAEKLRTPSLKKISEEPKNSE